MNNLLLCTKIGKSTNYFIMQWKMAFVTKLECLGCFIKRDKGSTRGKIWWMLCLRLRLQLLFNYNYISNQTIVLNALIMIWRLQFLWCVNRIVNGHGVPNMRRTLHRTTTMKGINHLIHVLVVMVRKIKNYLLLEGQILVKNVVTCFEHVIEQYF
jgi:hypothetical protein